MANRTAVNTLLTEGAPSSSLIPAAAVLVQRRYRKRARKATLFYSIEVSADDVDDIVVGLFRGFGIARHVVARCLEVFYA